VNAATFVVLVYVALQLAVGAWVGRRVRTEDDYLVAGRSLGYPLAVFSIFATWFGAETCIGAAGEFYEDGLAGGTADPFGYALCLLLMGILFAAPLWRLRLLTIADLYRRRFSPGVERLVVVLMVPTSLLWAAAQIRAFGQILAVTAGLDPQTTIAIAAGAVMLYTAFGGLLADAWTDLIQGIVLIAGLATLFVAVMAGGGAEALASVEPRRLGLSGGRPWPAVLEAWAIPVVGSVFAAELVSRIIACRSPVVARRASIAGGGIYLAVGLMPAALGLAGPALVGDLDHPEQVLPALAARSLPPILQALFAGAIISAILSTVDSALLVAGGLVAHNLLLGLRPGGGERARLLVARGAVLGFGVVAYVLAIQARGVHALVSEASAFGSAGVFVTLVMGLTTGLGVAPSAYGALLAGVAAWIGGAYIGEVPYPYLGSIAAALAAYLVLVPVTMRRSRDSRA
jgi:Na+/proline symporter